MSRPGLQHRPSSIAAANKTIILVTGGNTGIGYEIVKSLSRVNPSNYQVLLGCRETHKGEEAASSLGAPINVNPIQLDIEDDQSIEHAVLAIQQIFGKLDVLINNAGTAAQHLPKESTLRQKFDHTFSVNVTSQAVLTERFAPLLEKSKLPKVIFVSSIVASIESTLQGGEPYPGIWYSSSKSALNALAVWYAKSNPRWKVNAVCPGYRATGLNGAELTEETDPKLGAVRVVELVAEGPDGVSGTYSNKDRTLPW
jgi:NAD(P)-dependent dehydrogenase (short-subunit alcohol dehydrogenase family)